MFTLRRAVNLSVLGLAMLSATALANGGTQGYSGMQGTTCSVCHTGGGGALTLGGSTTVTGGTTVSYTVSGGPNAIDIAIDNPLAKITGTSANMLVGVNELSSRNGGPWTFTIDAPHTGGTVKVYAAGVTGTSLASPTATVVSTINVSVTPGPPIVSKPAKADEKTITGKSTLVHVLGVDETPESGTTYTWSATGPAPVTFTPNGTNAAKDSTANFALPGAYKLTATLTDPGNLSSTSSVDVTVETVISDIVITPAEVGLPPGGIQQFNGQGKDQFGGVIAMQPQIDWSVTPGGGSINATTGVYRASNSPGTSVVVSAVAGNMRSVATVTIANGAPPTIGPNASSLMTGLTSALSVGASDAAGEPSLKYTWSLIAGAGTVTFTPNGDNSAKKSTAVFSTPGVYKIQIQVKNPSLLTASQTLTLTAGASGATSGTTEAPAPGPDPVPTATDEGGGSCASTGGLALWGVLGLLPLVRLRRSPARVRLNR